LTLERPSIFQAIYFSESC